MKVKEIMKTSVTTITADTTCEEAAKIFIEQKISGAPILDNQGKLVGVLSEKDIFRALFPSYHDFYENPEACLDYESLEKDAALAGKEKVSTVMANRLITASPDTPILKIAAQMIASGIHRIPVVDNGGLVGIVSRRDIYRAIMRKYLGLWDQSEKK